MLYENMISPYVACMCDSNLNHDGIVADCVAKVFLWGFYPIRTAILDILKAISTDIIQVLA